MTNREKISNILGNGNEYFSGNEIWDALDKSGYVIVKRKPTTKMLAAGQAGLDLVPISRCEEQATKVWNSMISIADRPASL